MQRRALRIPYFPGDPSTDERRALMGIQELKVRRIRGDLIEKFKIQRGLDMVRWAVEPMCVDGIGGKRRQCRREIVKGCDQRHNFFNNRIANYWNSLPDTAVNVHSTNAFKKEIDSIDFVIN